MWNWKEPPDYRQQIQDLAALLAEERERCARAEGQLDLAQRQLAIAQNNFEWARVRLNQIEAERAQYLAALIQRPLQPLAIERQEPEVAAPAVSGGGGLPNMLGFDFEDVGDDAARRLGIDHDAGGAVTYRN